MLDKCSIEERWTAVSDIIDRWLQERKDLIVQFCGISGIHQYSPKASTSASRLQKFCEVLVDYISAGHFEVYYQLIREAEEFKDGSAEAGKQLLPEIQDTTEIALAFDDRYGESKVDDLPDNLPKQLSALGEILATRFDLEDKLIAVMHEAHREQVA